MTRRLSERDSPPRRRDAESKRKKSKPEGAEGAEQGGRGMGAAGGGGPRAGQCGVRRAWRSQGADVGRIADTAGRDAHATVREGGWDGLREREGGDVAGGAERDV